MEEYLFVGDIAGQVEALEALDAKVPSATLFCVGDLIDRGPDSNKVVEYVKRHGKSLLGNHEHMLINFCRETGLYDYNVWFYNGGVATIKSYIPDVERVSDEYIRKVLLDSGVVDYLESLPLYFETPARDDGLKALVTHAPLESGLSLEKACEFVGVGYATNDWNAGRSIIWNRMEPGYLADTLQVFGHNSPWGHTWFQDKSAIENSPEIIPWGVCLDSSRDDKLTAIHWPSLEIYQQDYI